MSLKPSLGDDTRSPWKFWTKSAEWQDELHRRAAHKSLDIPEEMGISNDRYGIGALGAVGIALAAGLPSALLAAMLLMNNSTDVGVQESAPRDVEEVVAPQNETDDSVGTQESYTIESKVRG